jgi:tripartite-type tricarboxylate transporter receptor subunit TctC
LSEATGQTFVVENRPGASGLIASEQVAKSPADGYTILVGSQTTMAVAPALYRKIQIDATKDFTGLAMIGISPLVAVVNANSPIRSIQDLVAEAKAKNGAMNFGSGGVGTTPHMAGELLAFQAGIKMVHVAYRGEAPGINDLLGGQIPFMFSNLSVVGGNVQGGTLRALAVTSTKRVPSLPDVPTIAESGYPGFETSQWYGILVANGTPAPIVERLHREIVAALAKPETTKRIVEDGGVAVGNTPAEFAALIAREEKRWGEVVRNAGVKPE